MTLELSSFTNKEFLYNMPDSFQRIIKKVWHQNYEELYEPETEGITSLSHAIDEILELYKDNNQTLTHLRYVWMALILALVVEPTIKYYQPSCSITEKTIKYINLWLLEVSENMFNSNHESTQSIGFNYQGESDNIIQDIKNNCNFNDSKLTSFQIWQEALDVYINAIKILDFNHSLKALIEILDDCLEGYAIFPGSQGRRELFNWWLLDVVPSAWYLLPPNYFYVLDNLENRENIVSSQMEKLKNISSTIWSILSKSELSTLLPSLRHNHLDGNSVSKARVGWNEAFAQMAENKDDILLDDCDTNSWDKTEWKW